LSSENLNRRWTLSELFTTNFGLAVSQTGTAEISFKVQRSRIGFGQRTLNFEHSTLNCAAASARAVDACGANR